MSVVAVRSLCNFARANLVFLVDSSRQICGGDNPCSEWSSVRNFIQTVVDQLNIGSNQVRVGLVRYGTSVQNVFRCNDPQVDQSDTIQSNFCCKIQLSERNWDNMENLKKMRLNEVMRKVNISEFLYAQQSYNKVF